MKAEKKPQHIVGIENRCFKMSVRTMTARACLMSFDSWFAIERATAKCSPTAVQCNAMQGKRQCRIKRCDARSAEKHKP